MNAEEPSFRLNRGDSGTNEILEPGKNRPRIWNQLCQRTFTPESRRSDAHLQLWVSKGYI